MSLHESDTDSKSQVYTASVSSSSSLLQAVKTVIVIAQQRTAASVIIIFFIMFVVNGLFYNDFLSVSDVDALPGGRVDALALQAVPLVTDRSVVVFL